MIDRFENFLVPVGSTIICCAFWWEAGRYSKVIQILIMVILLMINIFAYRMRQKIRMCAAKDSENEILRQQNEYFHLYYEEIEKQWLKLRRMRHDMINSYALEMGYLEKGQYGILAEHYQEKLGRMNEKSNIIHTGNVAIDSILNYKLGIAQAHQIDVESKIKIENEVAISHIDLNILIGNLFDNAVEAVEGLLSGSRRIHMVVGADKSAFFLEIRNPCKGKMGKDGNFQTSKKDKIFHGIGLKEVEEIAKKYDGTMEVRNENGEFDVKVFLFLDKGGSPLSRTERRKLK